MKEKIEMTLTYDNINALREEYAKLVNNYSWCKKEYEDKPIKPYQLAYEKAQAKMETFEDIMIMLDLDGEGLYGEGLFDDIKVF